MMRIKLLCALGAFGFLATPQAVYAICGDNNLEVGEQCDDNNVADGDGCSSLCQTEDAFVCEEVSFALFTEEQLAGGTTPNWVIDPERRGVTQTTNSQAAVFNTNMDADLTEIVFDMRVFTAQDNDLIGFTIGYDAGEMTATAADPPLDIDYLYFSWKQGQQNFGGVRRPGFIASRVEGPASAGEYWNGRLGNITQLAEATSYPLGVGSGWDDERWYRLNVQVLPNRIRVWVREGNTTATTDQDARGFPVLDRTSDLEFDLVIDVPPGKFGLFAMSQPNVRYELVTPLLASECVTDTDRDGVKDTTDLDSDGDGILDGDEMPGFPTDPDADSDLDGVPDWNDPDHIPGGCTSAAGICTSLPPAFDADGDGAPNHLDQDADGDGITDAREAGLADADGNGTPDMCTLVNSDGVCDMGALTEPATDTDMAGGPDYLDTDSDGDGLTDLAEAHDASGDGVADVTPSGFDTDGDGIDDAYDADCAALTCMGRIGAPVLGVLTPAQDSNLDGTPDWQTLCGDAYVRGTEGCDDGNSVDADMCTSACLITNGNGCTASEECDSTTCDADLMTCQPCDDTTETERDRGCTAGLPACATSAGVNMCVECTGDAQCGGGEVCVNMMCVFCSDDVGGIGTDTGCNDASPLCDTSGAVPTCRHCIDDTAGGADTGCTASLPVCDATTP
ncbi:MAG: cysteine-rich repeat protein, partial [Polyangiales bacterium]